MKQIANFINERLHVTTKSHLYSCKPNTWDELQEIIIQRINDDGNECDLNDIDVSKIDDMSYMFCVSGNKIFENFNGDISRWDVSNVENMDTMFYGCKKFNCDISRWDVSNVKYIQYMFKRCTNFKQNIDDWNVSNVENMEDAFKACHTKPKWYKYK